MMRWFLWAAVAMSLPGCAQQPQPSLTTEEPCYVEPGVFRASDPSPKAHIVMLNYGGYCNFGYRYTSRHDGTGFIALPPIHGQARMRDASTTQYRPLADFAGEDRFQVQFATGQPVILVRVSVVATRRPTIPVADPTSQACARFASVNWPQWALCMNRTEAARNPDYGRPDIIVASQRMRVRAAEAVDKGVITPEQAQEIFTETELWVNAHTAWLAAGHPPPGKTYMTPPDRVAKWISDALNADDILAQLKTDRPPALDAGPVGPITAVGRLAQP